ncbi:MAG: YIP1 family protein [Euryarchaeota archaeon]|nr:YIP1 family protein [Euryarchaeota archaeon]
MESQVRPPLFGRIKRAVMLEQPVYAEIRDDPNALGQSFLVVLLSGICQGIGYFFLLTFAGAMFGPFGMMGGGLAGAALATVVPILAIIGWFISSGIVHLFALLLGGKANFTGFLRAMGFAYAPAALGIIPIIGAFIGGIWVFICEVFAVKVVHELTLGRALLALLLPVIIVIIFVILGSLYFAFVMRPFSRYYIPSTGI